MEIDDITMYRYEVGMVLDGGRTTISCSDDLSIVEQIYEVTLTRHQLDPIYESTIIYIYDYEKNCNIKYYDSTTDKS